MRWRCTWVVKVAKPWVGGEGLGGGLANGGAHKAMTWGMWVVGVYTLLCF